MILLQDHFGAARRLFAAFGVELQRVGDGVAIPGSYWGDSEAGLVGSRLYWRGSIRRCIRCCTKALITSA